MAPDRLVIATFGDGAYLFANPVAAHHAAKVHDLPILTVIFSYIARQANNILQAVFGWSVTALFGKLPRRAQVLARIARDLSLPQQEPVKAPQRGQMSRDGPRAQAGWSASLFLIR